MNLKTTFKTVIILSFFMTLSCSSDDDAQPQTQLTRKMTSYTNTQGSNINDMTFNYNAAGRWTSGMNRFDQNYTATYNSANKLLSYAVPSQNSSVDYAYSTTLLNGIMSDTYEIDFAYNNNQLTELEFYDGSLVDRLTMTYNSTNKLSTLTSMDQSTRWEFIYDNRNRVVRVNEYTAANSNAPYSLSFYTIYEYEDHKSPVFAFAKANLPTYNELLFSPVQFYPFVTRLLSYSDNGIDLFVLAEYNIKNIKQYRETAGSLPIKEVTMNYVMVGSEVQSFTTTIDDGTIRTEQTTYTYED